MLDDDILARKDTEHVKLTRRASTFCVCVRDDHFSKIIVYKTQQLLHAYTTCIVVSASYQASAGTSLYFFFPSTSCMFLYGLWISTFLTRIEVRGFKLEVEELHSVCCH